MVWMDRNFTTEYRDEMSQTAHVTANPYSDRLDPNRFHVLDEVWKYAWDDDRGTVPARAVTDRAVHVGREYEFDRLLIHYMQPHFPSVPKPLDFAIDIESFGDGWNSIWERLRDDEIDRQTVWNAYEANLRYVLDELSLLMGNLDAKKVVISADHGNAFGEWGQYGHPPNVPIRVLREVPWIETSARDIESHSPSLIPEHEAITNEDVESRLRYLGYR